MIKKSQIRRNYKYNIEKLRKNISKALVQIKQLIILGRYESYFKEMDLYKEKI